MAFPEVPRARYRLNLLDEVVCKLKFPAVLTIDTEPPAAFQQLVRATYPLYQTRAAAALPGGVPPEIAQLIQRDMALAGTRTHWFGSADNCLWAGLTRDSLSLHCRRYSRWEELRDRLMTPFRALVDVYAPAFLVHTCLRYRNVIRRAALPDPMAPWSHWLSPWVSGPLGAGDASVAVVSSQTRALFKLPSELGQVDATYGLAEEGAAATPVFIIDTHAFTEQRLEPNDAPARLDALHEQARRFFRWCITDDLHRALQPSPLPALGPG